ncbi:hypothetical protein ES708_06196 [subsurface metagenome]
MDLTIGCKGFLGYLKALGGSNIVKIVPSNGSAGGSQATDKRLKVICGANTSYLADSEFIGDNTPMTFCEVRVSPSSSVKPNVGAGELAEALNRVLPFTATDDTRPVLQCIKFIAKEGKLTLVSADGFRLAIVNLDYDDGEGEALINRDDLKGVASALRRAKRARVSFGNEDVTIPSSLIIDTELIRYKWVSVGGNFPEYEKLIPTDFNYSAHLDTVEALKAVNSLKSFATDKAYPIDLDIGDGKVVMADPDGKGIAELVADTDGQGKVRLDGQYLAEVLRACGGMVDFSLTNAYSPMLFSSNGYKVVVMPMLTSEANKEAKADREAKGEETTEPETTEPYEVRGESGQVPEPVTPTDTEPVAEKPKKSKRAKRSHKAKEPVTV